MRYALSVAKERSFTKAAKRLNISQSAVSEQVRSVCTENLNPDVMVMKSAE